MENGTRETEDGDDEREWERKRKEQLGADDLGSECKRAPGDIHFGDLALRCRLRHPGGDRCAQVQGLHPPIDILQEAFRRLR